MRGLVLISLMIIGLIFWSGVIHCAVFEKASDTRLRIKTETSQELTIQQMNAEINACNIDIKSAQDEIVKKTEEIAYYNSLLEQANNLGIMKKKPVEKIKEVVSE